MPTFFLPTFSFVNLLWSTRHSRAGILRAELSDGSIDQIDSIEEVNHMNSDPVIQLLVVW
jgi:hypothetical protein